MKQFLFFTTLLLTGYTNAQIYNMPTSPGSASTCIGLFYDSGGAGSNYGNNQGRTMTFCSSTPGQAIRVTFSAFDTELNGDILRVYDGNSTSAPLMGEYSGTAIPAAITGSAAGGGCLTFVFSSNASVPRPGWEATISCATPAVTPTYIPNFVSVIPTISTCGANFYDQGGPTQGYPPTSNAAYRTIRFCPGTSGMAASVTFTQFDTELYGDYLEVYDGTSTSDPLIGRFSGNSIPPTVTGSVAQGGCLTFVFSSNTNAVVGTGWAATVSCATPLTEPDYILNYFGTVSTCSANFYDVGGSTLGYRNGDYRGFTMCPSTPGDLLRATFLEFDTEVGADRLEVYNGNSYNTAPMVGNYSGTTLPPVTTATTAQGGCLSFLFVSNATVSRPGWKIRISCIYPLPIELVSFDAEAIDDYRVKIDWVTETETNNDYFQVERSTDGENWDVINTTDGAGNSVKELHYTAYDYHPLNGISYYRLKQVDTDGAFKISDIDVVNRNNTDGRELIIYPNPATDYLILEGNANDLAAFTLLNTMGQDIKSAVSVNMKSNSKIELDLSGLAKGTYVIKTSTTSYLFVKQ